MYMRTTVIVCNDSMLIFMKLSAINYNLILRSTLRIYTCKQMNMKLYLIPLCLPHVIAILEYRKKLSMFLNKCMLKCISKYLIFWQFQMVAYTYACIPFLIRKICAFLLCKVKRKIKLSR